ncbi:hypothetical protein E2C01_086629 [Portunus trituberculatus]|uniref:Uncharacterized protein n=1 Tax=Portunus trituberculatus TaxID=210409 RepID=A0A5B7JAV2_PORTR|nr:hypothetical protein [Portunus trituberculatus]
MFGGSQTQTRCLEWRRGYQHLDNYTPSAASGRQVTCTSSSPASPGTGRFHWLDAAAAAALRTPKIFASYFPTIGLPRVSNEARKILRDTAIVCAVTQ